MAYDLPRLFESVRPQLHSAPNMHLDELSRRLQVDRHTIKKAVKLATGKTFRELRKGILLEQAIKQLRSDPIRSIKQVAYDLGYGSQRSFCRFVRAVAGCSPKELRADANWKGISV
jgi:AraC-like DNA-binding protein